MKKLLLLVVILASIFFAHCKGWYTFNSEKAKADLHELMDLAFNKAGEALNKARQFADKPACKDCKEKVQSANNETEKAL